MNIFDSFVVSISIVQLSLGTGSSNLSALRSIRILRAFRVLRITRLIRSLNYMKIVMSVVSSVITEFVYIFILSKGYFLPYYFKWLADNIKVYIIYSLFLSVFISYGCVKVLLLSLLLSFVIYVIMFIHASLPSLTSRVSGRVVDCV